MNDKKHDGISQAVLEDFIDNDLPLIERSLAEVKAGKRLSDGEIIVLAQQLERIKDWHEVSWEIPEYNSLLAKIIASYDEITSLALKNEQANN